MRIMAMLPFLHIQRAFVEMDRRKKLEASVPSRHSPAIPRYDDRSQTTRRCFNGLKLSRDNNKDLRLATVFKLIVLQIGCSC